MSVSRGTRRPEGATSDQIGLPILVIEDQRSLAQMLSAMLRERWGCSVELAHSRAQAEQAVASGRPFLVAICDLNLPDAPHGEALDAVMRAGIPAVALTAAFGEELRESVLKKGVVDYVLKENLNAYSYVCELVGRLSRNRSIKALVVDDAASTRAMLKQFLERFGLQVITAGNGVEALRALEAHPETRLMLVDYHMPEMDGFALTVEARKLYGKDRLAIIGISAGDHPSLSARLLKNGANDFISKPFTFEEVVCRASQNLEMLELIEVNQKAARCDFLTGLFNRRHFFTTGSAQCAVSARLGEPNAVAIIDIDHFKRVNDEHGHECGDAILREIAERMNSHFAGHLLARLGGEEFAVLFAPGAAQQAPALLESLRRAVERRRFHCAAASLSITLSAGLAVQASGSLDELLREADGRLYRAKTEGRNRVVTP